MAIGDGARGVAKGATVTVRDVRALRVKLLNHAKLIESIGGHGDTMLAELDAIGATDTDKRTLLVRSLELLHTIAGDTSLKQAVRWRAAKTITETVVELSKDRTKARTAAATLAQQSNEHADRVALKARELDILEATADNGGPPAGRFSDDDLRKIAHGAPPSQEALAPSVR